MDYLPTPAEQASLIEAMAELVEQRGAAAFFATTRLPATAEPCEAGALLRQAGLGQLAHDRGLAPQAMCFLLALHNLAHALSAGQRAAVASRLDHDQRAFYQTALRVLERSGAVAGLGLGGGPPGDHGERTAECQPGDEEAGPALWKATRVVFRVREPTVALWSGMGALVGVVVSSLLCALASRRLWWLIPIATVVGLLVGRGAGKQRVTYRCSDHRCAAALGASQPVCAGCGGTVMGRYDGKRHRPEADDAMLDELRIDRRRRQQRTRGDFMDHRR